MTDILDQAVEALRHLPADDRDTVARAILSFARCDDRPDIEPEHLLYVMEGLAQIERGDFVEGEPEELVAAAFRRAR